MDYFVFDYKKANKEINFHNYESFISNNKTYKYYLYDLMLLRFDKNKSEEIRNKAKNHIFMQKLIFFAPYPIISLLVFLKYRSGFFSVQFYHLEQRYFFNLFMGLLGYRILQKAYLKYEGDKILIEEAQ